MSKVKRFPKVFIPFLSLYLSSGEEFIDLILGMYQELVLEMTCFLVNAYLSFVYVCYAAKSEAFWGLAFILDDAS